MPGSVREGALDWMGMAHMLGEEGTAEPLSRFGPRFPLLAAADVFLFSYDPEQATDHERGVIGRRGLKSTTVEKVASAPDGTATRALAEMETRFDRLIVHFDVDTVDFTDLPLSENTRRNAGLPFDAAMRALGTLLGSEKLAAVTVTEFNPDHGAEDGSTAEALADGLARALLGSHALGSREATSSPRLSRHRHSDLGVRPVGHARSWTIVCLVPWASQDRSWDWSSRSMPSLSVF